jgi:hypothetical protein
MLKALPSFTLLVDGLSPRRSAFDNMPDHSEFEEGEVDLGQVFMWFLLFPSISIIPPKLNPRISFIYDLRYSLSNWQCRQMKHLSYDTQGFFLTKTINTLTWEKGVNLRRPICFPYDGLFTVFIIIIIIIIFITIIYLCTIIMTWL